MKLALLGKLAAKYVEDVKNDWIKGYISQRNFGIWASESTSPSRQFPLLSFLLS
jgi:hypothetical protein